MAVRLQTIVSAPSASLPTPPRAYAIERILHVTGGRTLLAGRQRDPARPVVIERISGLSARSIAKALAYKERLMALSHPNLARCIDLFVEDETLWIVMVTGEGRSLGEVGTPLSHAQVIDAGVQLCNVLNYLEWATPHMPSHIDPFAVFLTSAGRVKLTSLAELTGVAIPRYRSRVATPPLSRSARRVAGVGLTMQFAMECQGNRLLSGPCQIGPHDTEDLADTMRKAIMGSWEDSAQLRYALLRIPTKTL